MGCIQHTRHFPASTTVQEATGRCLRPSARNAGNGGLPSARRVYNRAWLRASTISSGGGTQSSVPLSIMSNGSAGCVRGPGGTCPSREVHEHTHQIVPSLAHPMHGLPELLLRPHIVQICKDATARAPEAFTQVPGCTTLGDTRPLNMYPYCHCTHKPQLPSCSGKFSSVTKQSTA